MRRIAFPSSASTCAVGGLLLLLGGCSSGGDAKALGPVPTAPSPSFTTVAETTTVVPTTSTTVARVTTTQAPAVPTSTTTVRPVLVDGVPQVPATPSQAAVGARVRIEGTGFTDEMWKARPAPLWLAGTSGCNLFAQAEHTITVSASGRLAGDFVVPATGNCRMSDVGERPVTSGSYRIVFTCTACAIGELQVTTTAGACVDVGFAPNTDNVAGDIVATGLSCADAEALVRKVGMQARPVGGPSRVEVDGFVCLRTAESDRGLPSSDFECTSGSKKVTFRRT